MTKPPPGSSPTNPVTTIAEAIEVAERTGVGVVYVQARPPGLGDFLDPIIDAALREQLTQPGDDPRDVCPRCRRYRLALTGRGELCGTGDRVCPDVGCAWPSTPHQVMAEILAKAGPLANHGGRLTDPAELATPDGVMVIPVPPYPTRGDLYQLEGPRPYHAEVTDAEVIRTIVIDAEISTDNLVVRALEAKVIGRDARARGDNPAERVPAPLPGRRCPRCHHTAPRADGIPCSLCAPGDTSPEAAAERHADAMAEVERATDSLWDRIHQLADEDP